MTNVQIAVRLRRESRLHATAVLTRGHLLGHDLADEIAAGLGAVFFGSHGRALSFMRGAKLNLLARREARDPLLEQRYARRIDHVRRDRRHPVRVPAVQRAPPERSSRGCQAQ